MVSLQCPVCGFTQSPDDRHGEGEKRRCAGCRRIIKAQLLPALYRGAGPPVLLNEAPLVAGENACFYNPNRRATKVCSHCGVFVSDAWSAVWGTATVCLKCLENLCKSGKDRNFETRRTLWDNVSLYFSIGPFIVAGLLLLTLIGYPFSFLTLFATIATAPIAIFIALRYWNAPRSLVPRGRGRLIVAIGTATLQIFFWVGIVIAMIVAIGN